MENKNLKMMSVDDLWSLHEELCATLSAKLHADKRELEHRIARLTGVFSVKNWLVDLTRRSIQNTAIRRDPLKPGPDEENNRAG